MQTRTATAVSSPNIAFVKYWGNRDDRLRLPSNGSISMNLAGLDTRTTVEFDPSITEDEFTLQGTRQEGGPLARVSDHLDLLRARAGASWKARVASENNFPTGAGIASSASAFAALTVAAAAALGLKLAERDLSILARRGSGSASRSIPDGFVEWHAADEHDRSYAESIAGPSHWALVDLIAIIDAGPKKVGSAEGNRLARTSPLQAARAADAPRRLDICRRAIRDKDFSALAEIIEEDTLLMHEVMRTSTPALNYLQAASLTLMRSIPQWRAGGLSAAFTVDAGPNVHCLCLEESAAEAERRLREIPAVRQILRARPGDGAKVVAGEVGSSIGLPSHPPSPVTRERGDGMVFPSVLCKSSPDIIPKIKQRKGGEMEFFGNILDWVLALSLFGLFLFIHELGHFLMARLTGVKVEEFGFGFPPRLVKLFTWQGTLFSLNAIPFGGFVRPVGEDDPNVEGGLAGARKRVRVLVLLGGIILNALAAVVSLTIAFKIAFPEGAMIEVVTPDTPAEQAGVRIGDRILALDGVQVKYVSEVIDYIHSHLGKEVTLHLSRDGEELDILVTPRLAWPEGQGPTGMVLADAFSGGHSWGEAYGEGIRTIREQLKLVLQLPAMILRGGFSDPALRPVGPLGIIDVTEQFVSAARENNRWVIILQWIGVINLALAIGNILPIPALDGGRLVFVFLEAIRGKRVDPEKERMVHAYSLLVLVVLMLVITYMDVFFPVLPR